MFSKYFTYQLIGRRVSATAALALGWLVCLLPAALAQTAALPDIIYILSDDQAYTDYSFMGHQHIRTPNLDQLAKESRLFTRGYVPDSLCRPSLATIITGLYPHQHGIVGNDPPPAGGWKKGQGKNPGYANKEYQQQIEKFLQLHIDRLETLPDRLKKLGYASYQTGKWWEGHPSRGGFDAGMTHGDHSRGGRHGDVGLEIGRNGLQPVENYVKQARAANQPYFLWYAPMMPHTPHNPPERWLAPAKAVAPTEAIAKYWAMCQWFDETIGQLRDIVKQHGRPDNTLIVYVTDNGWINLPDRSAYAPRSKRSQYEGGIRTPIMFCWPGHIAPGRDDEHLASSIDLVPTTLALLGQPKPAELPGIDLLNSTALDGRQAVYGEILEHDIQDMDRPESSLMARWMISGYQKFILPGPAVGGQPELYDLKADPQEKQNRGATLDQPSIQAWTNRLDQYWPVPKS